MQLGRTLTEHFALARMQTKPGQGITFSGGVLPAVSGGSTVKTLHESEKLWRSRSLLRKAIRDSGMRSGSSSPGRTRTRQPAERSARIGVAVWRAVRDR